jgi:hypothetical protein
MSKVKWMGAVLVASSLALTAGLAAGAQDSDVALGTVFAGARPGIGAADAASPRNNSAPWVNVRLRDFSDAPPGDYGTYEWIRKTVEVQISVDDGYYQQSGVGCCQVQGLGNLKGTEYLSALYLNFNKRLNLHKLKLYWTGKSMPPGVPTGADTFPVAGKEPVEVSIGKNAFHAGPGGDFDVKVVWKDGDMKPGGWSKLLFVYDDGKEEISPADFSVASRDPRSPYAPFVAVGQIKGIEGSKEGWIKQ